MDGCTVVKCKKMRPRNSGRRHGASSNELIADLKKRKQVSGDD